MIHAIILSVLLISATICFGVGLAVYDDTNKSRRQLGLPLNKKHHIWFGLVGWQIIIFFIYATILTIWQILANTC